MARDKPCTLQWSCAICLPLCRKATDQEEERYYVEFDAAMQQLDVLLAEEDAALKAEALKEAQALSRYIPGADKEPTYPSPQDARDVSATCL